MEKYVYTPEILFKAIFKKSNKTYLITEQGEFVIENTKTGCSTDSVLWYTGYLERNGKIFGAQKRMKASDMIKVIDSI